MCVCMYGDMGEGSSTISRGREAGDLHNLSLSKSVQGLCPTSNLICVMYRAV